MPASNKQSLYTKDLIKLAANNAVADVDWLNFMNSTLSARKALQLRHDELELTKFRIELCVKIAASIILGASIFLTTPLAATLIAGAAVTLFLSSIIYSFFNPIHYSVSMPRSIAPRQEDDEARAPSAQISAARRNWLEQANESTTKDEVYTQSRLMNRIAFVLVVGFSLFAATVSGAGLALSIASAFYAVSLLWTSYAKDKVYVEEGDSNRLPSLS